MASLADTTLQGTAEAARVRQYEDEDLAKGELNEKRSHDDNVTSVEPGHGPDYPNAHQRATLKRVPGNINFAILTIAFIEVSFWLGIILDASETDWKLCAIVC